MADRVLGCLIGITGTRATDELGVRANALVEDGYAIAAEKRGLWCALPAPHLLGIHDVYYHDEAEWSGAINKVYKTLLQEMRDAGVAGHILIAGSGREEEVAALARQNVIFFVPHPDRPGLETLLEHQHVIAVENDHLGPVFGLVEEYDIRKIIIIDADREGIATALSHLDPDQVVAGGYCTVNDNDYWKRVIESSEYEK